MKKEGFYQTTKILPFDRNPPGGCARICSGNMLLTQRKSGAGNCPGDHRLCLGQRSRTALWKSEELPPHHHKRLFRRLSQDRPGQAVRRGLLRFYCEGFSVLRGTEPFLKRFCSRNRHSSHEVRIRSIVTLSGSAVTVTTCLF